ncbi:hypothetical protein FYJ88_02755 [Corynebacterium urealyticum]|uniref:hypothetical protein n=1 Tax=Corynebacterium urealyticum TaxID=43771 RepID=UPI0011E6FC3F|nr:hypothetical protein [Corynebacterium urealyticum]TYR17775.1 hypothetical protein FYJ88_02755 [Corynebacterium urealyticum]
MACFDTPLIKAFFADETIRNARALDYPVQLRDTAPFVYRTTIGGAEVQLDGAMFPGCSDCSCAEFRAGDLCAHLCAAAAHHFSNTTNELEFFLPDASAAVRPELLEHPLFYELRMALVTYSPAYEEQTLTGAILNKAVQCRGKIADEKIAAEVLRLLNESFHFLNEKEDPALEALFDLLEELNAPEGEIESLRAQWEYLWEPRDDEWEFEWLDDEEEDSC